MHATESGVVDHLATSDAHALTIARNSVASLSYHALGFQSNFAQGSAKKEYDEPIYKAEELGGIVGTNLRKKFDMREVIARVVDGSRMHEWKKNYGETVVTGFGSFCFFFVLEGLKTLLIAVCVVLICDFIASIHGYPVGIVRISPFPLSLVPKS